MPMEAPHFPDWESYSEIEMSVDDINVIFELPEYEQNQDDIVLVQVDLLDAYSFAFFEE